MTKIVRTSEIKEGELEENPRFNEKGAGVFGITVIDGGGVVNGTVIPVVKKLIGEMLDVGAGTTTKFYHGLNNRYYSFMRVKVKTSGKFDPDKWVMHKNYYITENYIYITTEEDIKFEVFFTNDAI